MKRLMISLMLIVSPLGCMTVRVSLPTDPVLMTIIQRHGKPIPGSHKAVHVEIGDITGGQVLLSIRGRFGRSIVDTVSVSEGEAVEFEIDRTPYRLKVIELRNFLIGDDFGVFEISSTNREEK